jgi:hypothetical protein
MFVFKKYDWQNHLRFLCNFTSWSGETPTGNFSDVFLSWTRIMSVLIGWPIKTHWQRNRICFSIQPQIQLVNLHRKQRYFVIKLHTWFCLSYFLKTNIKFYCIYQYFINSFFNTVSVSQYLWFLCKFTSWSGETPTGNFNDVFLSWTRIICVLIGWPHGKKTAFSTPYLFLDTAATSTRKFT